MPVEKLTLAHQELLFSRLKRAGTSLSDFSFANLYLFRKAHDYRVLLDGPEVFITGKTYDGHSFIMPTRNIQELSAADLSRLIRGYDFIFPVPEEWLKSFPEDMFTRAVAEGDSDYVYTLQKMATYSGTKLHGKKNLLNQFLGLYHPEAKPLTNDLMADAGEVLEAWQKESSQSPADTDYHSCQEALALYDTLVLCGGIYYADAEPAGFIIGEELNESMFALHFAKAKIKFKGIYQYMFNHFANILPKKYQFLNLEQDIGIPALKAAKASYHPDHMLKKFRISWKG